MGFTRHALQPALRMRCCSATRACAVTAITGTSRISGFRRIQAMRSRPASLPRLMPWQKPRNWFVQDGSVPPAAFYFFPHEGEGFPRGAAESSPEPAVRPYSRVCLRNHQRCAGCRGCGRHRWSSWWATQRGSNGFPPWTSSSYKLQIQFERASSHPATRDQDGELSRET